MILPVILAGGNGSRLWPISRAMHPKQFLNIVGHNTMIQETVNRLERLNTDDPLIVCNSEHRFLVAEQLTEVGIAFDIILEPVARNTAPAIALAALKSVNEGIDPLLLVLAADHVIEDTGAFEEAVNGSIELANRGFLITFGIVPNCAETGFGYIHRGEVCQETNGNLKKYYVKQFVEKPNRETAQHYLDSGEHYWNSGMFLFKASRYLEELERYAPDILSACKASMNQANRDLDFIRVDEELFSSCPSDSIDYAVMEKTEQAVVMPLNTGWSDIGAWSALLDLSETDNDGNYLQGDVVTHDSRNCLVYGKERLVSLLGMEDVVVIDTKDAILVADRNHVQDVKSIVDQLKHLKREEWEFHREVYRPWGKYDSIDVGERYQVKRITVKPGAKLSVQMHNHRAEHWIVVSGTAKVTNGENTFLVTENHSTYIPIGEIHALENPGKIPLELIEVQTGSYLGEDDIVRLEDVYGRESIA
jgi:mannose-1-phosphate guanylyltransferase